VLGQLIAFRLAVTPEVTVAQFPPPLVVVMTVPVTPTA
jgi:hypothetical protein